MKKIGFLLITYFLICCVQVSLSQTVQKLNIQFNTNEFILTQNAKNQIDSVINLLSNIPEAYSVDVIGHTDNVGNMDFNKNLSLKRAKETANYFQNKGFLAKKIKYEGKSYLEQIADNKTEQGKLQNRRVEILIGIKKPSSRKIDKLKTIPKEYIIKPNEESYLEYKSGTVIYIPENSFVDADGNEVKGNVKIKYAEYREPIDFILSAIPMRYMFGNEMYHFNSAGMFYIDAFSNNKQVYLKNGSNIQLNFALTEDLPQLNFYRFDTITNEWAELAKDITNKDPQNNSDGKSRAVSINSRGGKIDGDFIGDDFKIIDSVEYKICENIFAAVRLGQFYISDTILLNEKYKNANSFLNKFDKLNKVKEENNQLVSSLNDDLTDEKRFYYLTKNKTKKKDEFIISVKSDSVKFNELEPLKDVNWLYKKEVGVKFSNALFKTNWTVCKIYKDQNNEGISIFVYDSITKQQFTFNNVQMNFNTKIKKDELKLKENQLIAKYDSCLTKFKKIKIEAQFKKDSVQNVINNIKIKNDSLKNNVGIDKYNIAFETRNFLINLWSSNKEFMNKGEDSLTISDWLDYFDNNKNIFSKRYDSLNQTKKYLKCYYDFAQNSKMLYNLTPEEIIKRKIEEGKRREEQKKRIEKKETQERILKDVIKNNSALYKRLSISNLGIYNCDQIVKFSNVILVKADYKNSKGEKIEPVIINLIDSKFNGVISYDGYNGYSPYKFKYNPTSINTILAFDKDNKAYIFTSEQFKEINPQGEEINYTFILKEIKNISKKETLKNLF